MTEFQEDMLFKNVSEEDIQILLEILEKESESANIWTKELRLLDPTTYKPDLIIELDDENLIIEFQSTEVNDKFSRRAHTYVAITDQKKENDKEVNIEVISTAENSKQISYRVNRLNTFRYNVIGFEKYDGEKIIKYVEEKLENNMKITSKDNIYLSLAPLMDKKKNNNISEKIKRVVDLLIELNKTNPPGNKLSFGITWLLVDKFVKDSELRNLLIDVLGEKMSAIYEYGERKEQKGIEKGRKEGIKEGKKEGIKEGKKEGKKEGIKEGKEEIILKLYESGMTPEEISKRLKTDLEKIKKIINE